MNNRPDQINRFPDRPCQTTVKSEDPDEDPDLDHEVADGGEGAAVDGLAFDDPEPDLDEVEATILRSG
jgi:hypothetical protein